MLDWSQCAAAERVPQRIRFDLPQTRVDLVEEFIPQAAPALLIPVKPLGQIRLSLGLDDERAAHVLRAVMRAQTSAHGEPTFGFPSPSPCPLRPCIPASSK